MADNPFKFTDKGYTAPSDLSSPGELQGAINVLQAQPYLNETYTYEKYKNKYIVGYTDFGIQVIEGKTMYGGIRDLGGTIIAKEALKQAYITANIRGLMLSPNLYGSIDAHFPSNLQGLIRPWAKGSVDLPATLRIWQQKDLSASFTGTHLPVDLLGSVFVKNRTYTDFPASVRGWEARDITGHINSMYPVGLLASIELIKPGELSAYLRPRLIKNLPANLKVWQKLDLTASMLINYADNLPAYIVGRTDMRRNLGVILKGVAHSYSDLKGQLYSIQTNKLTGIIRATYLSDLKGFLRAVPYVNLGAKLQTYHEAYLPASLFIQEYPWNLTASINSTGGSVFLGAYLRPSNAVVLPYDLQGKLHSWISKGLTAYISGENAAFLTASLRPLGQAGDLHAEIRPKMISLTTRIAIPTMEHRGLSAMINASCMRTGWSTLGATLYAKFSGDLFAYIRPVSEYQERTLTASVGKDNSYLTLDKLKLSININPSPYYVEDRLKLRYDIVNTGNILFGYIKGILRSESLTATLTVVSPKRYSHDRAIQNTVRVVNKDYQGIFQSYKTVEMYFREAVKTYYFSSESNYAWKEDIFDRWVLDVRSYIPAARTLKIKRKLFKAITLYDLKSFSTVDEALKFAFDYVTQYPNYALTASITSSGLAKGLTAKIMPKYTVNTDTGLSATVVVNSPTVIINKDDGTYEKF